MDSQSVSLTSVVSVEPNQIFFRNYKLGQPVTQILSIINTSNKEQRFHILPLGKGPFSLRYEKKHNLLPGMKQIIQLQFHPNDFEKCSETLRIECPNGQNLSIPITAVISPNLTGFPNTLHFPNTPVNANTSLQFTLTSDVYSPFQFRMGFNPPTDVFAVIPSSGSIQADESIPITVTFCPQKLRTSISNLEITISDTDVKVRTCSCTGSCLPMSLNPPVKIHTADKISPETVQKVKLTKRRLVIHKDAQKHIVCSTRIESKETCPIVIRDKERDFLLAVRQRKEDEKLNQLKWSKNLGHSSITESEINLLKTQREPVISTQISISKHTILESIKLERTDDISRLDYHILISFNRETQILNWRRKRELLSIFCLAAKRVVIQQRADRRLKSLKSFIREVKKLDLPADKYDTIFSKPKSSDDTFKSMTPKMPIPFLFIRDQSIDEMEPVVPFVPIKMEMPVWEMEEEEEPLFQIVPPDYAEQQCYKKLPLAAVDSFLPFSFDRKKRKGAEHEYVGILTEKRDDVSELTEEIIQTPTHPIPEHLLKDTSTLSTSVTIAPYDAQSHLPMYPVTGIEPKDPLLPLKATTFGDPRKNDSPEQREEPERFERNDQEKEFRMIREEQLTKGKEFQEKVDSRMKMMKNLMSDKLHKEVPGWMW